MDAMRLEIKPRARIKKYTAEEFFKFTENKEERYELIDGRIYMMAAPAIKHQRIAGFIYRKLGDYLNGKPCEPFISPVDVVLFEKKNKWDKSQNVFEPDVFVVCDPEKISEERIYGAPDFIVEIVSPSNSERDYYYKCRLYMQYGVKEYWIVNPETKNILVYINGEEVKTHNYTFNDKIKVNIFEDFEIDFKELQI